MISKDEKSFNCCESTLIRIDSGHKLPGFGEEIMRAASNLGGGVGGWGSICGAVSGSAIALRLKYGTEGDEDTETFTEKREKMREITKEFMKAFEEEWGSVKCLDLLGVDFRTPEGKEEYEAMKERGETHCAEYVEWAADKIIEMLEE